MPGEGRPHFPAFRRCGGPRSSVLSARHSYRSSPPGHDFSGTLTQVELPAIPQPADEAAPKASPPPHFQPLERVRVAEPPPKCAWTASDRHRRPSPGPRSGDPRHLNPWTHSPDAAHLPAPGSRRAAAGAAAATEKAAAGAPAAAVAAAAGGLGPWPGLAPGAEPGRAGPRRRGGGHPQEDPLGGREKARARSQEIQERRGCNPGKRLRDPGGALSRAIPGDASRSVPRESGLTGPGGSRALGNLGARELGEAGRGGREQVVVVRCAQ